MLFSHSITINSQTMQLLSNFICNTLLCTLNISPCASIYMKVCLNSKRTFKSENRNVEDFTSVRHSFYNTSTNNNKKKVMKLTKLKKQEQVLKLIYHSENTFFLNLCKICKVCLETLFLSFTSIAKDFQKYF